MCLNIVSDRKIANPRKVRYGWKVFNHVVGPEGKRALNFECNPLRDQWRVPKGRWITSSLRILQSDPHPQSVMHPSFSIPYSAGFHIFTTKKDAMRWAPNGGLVGKKILRIRYRNIVDSGYQNGLRIHIARQLFVPLSAV